MSRHRSPCPAPARSGSGSAHAWCAAVAAAWAIAGLLPARGWAATTGRAAAPKSDMQISAVASAGFTSGSNATYTLTIDNNGPQTAPGANTVTNTLPAGLTFVSAVTTGGWACTNAGQVVTCTRAGTYAKTNATTITITAFITSGVATSVTNVATVADNGDDSNLANNTASTTSAVTVRRVATTPDGATTSRLPSNNTVNYTQTFVVTNNGNVADNYGFVATVAPAGVVTIISVDGTLGSSATTTSAVAAGGTRNVDVVYSVASGAAAGATARITLTVTSTATSSASDAGDVTVTVTRAGVTMTKALYRDDRTTLVTGPSAVSVGEYVQYRVTVTNGGTAPASTVSVSDPIPGAVTYDSATPDAAGWTIATAGGTLTANLAGTLGVGTSRFFWIRVRVK